MREFINEIELRNVHRIYREDEVYVVEQEDRNGQGHSTRVTLLTVQTLRDALRGEVATVEDAQAALAPVASSLGLPYTYGHKLQFYAQSVLLVLVALGEAYVEKEGRRYVYTIS